ncbi:Endonuclease/exonuclease/phosphatase [Cellulomonas fimi ATCC 484]|uniref:Endonuclease/exonuclease/phosphatase n=1 Tax=Cellulomonas fimi (strain ATCC 484 / DSM 20113 / JCM 1341 / CCUG 24087 / LMG 16345 / NBRC 15513 / NCIMB 8980 / NCTC 7547 / NRS-133) TaxID=590998 RepID=F4H812_CELFA|nr:Endonuclease/exonuclease/phosphatase [Cellulomonas fimi ATCC 484]
MPRVSTTARPGPPPTTPPDAGTATRVWLVAALTLAGLEAVRASGPFLDRWFAVGTVAAGGAAVVTYAGAGLVTAGLLTVLRRRAGLPDGRTLLVGAGVLAALRVALQALDGLALDVVGLVTVAVAVALLTLAVGHVAGRPGGPRQAATGLVVGGALSVALQLLLGTWDAVWRSSAAGWVVALVVAAAPFAARRGLLDVHASPEPAGRPRRLWALGPYLAVAAMLLANPAFAASQADVPLDAAGLVLVGSAVLGAWPLLRPDVWPAAVRVAAAVVLVLGVATALLATGPVALAALAVAQVCAGVVLATVLSTRRPAPPGIPRTALSTAGAGLGLVLTLLLYMLDYDVPLPVDNAWVVVAAAVVLALAGLRRRTPPVPAAAVVEAPPVDREPVPARVNPVRWLLVPAVVVAVVGVLVGGRGWSTTGPQVPAAAADDGTLTVVDWNLHYGVSPLTAVDLEAVARTIEEQDPDVVTLQEVQRGWVFGGGSDMATWLAHRLGMTVRFAPAADRQFGNAVLARSGLTDVAVHPLPYGQGPQERSALSATLTTADGGTVRVTSVHLQHRESATPTRLAQLDALLAAERVDGPALLAGDLNATPGSPELDLLTGAGWVSAVDAAGDADATTHPSTDPEQRIDWVLGQRGTFTEATVGTSTLSDHLPVTARWRPDAG